MKTQKLAALLFCATLASPAQSTAATKSGVLVMFQEALETAEYNVTSTGQWDEQTRSAMQLMQVENGLSITDYPDVETFALLEIDPSIWSGILDEAGAPELFIHLVSEEAQRLIAESISDSMREVFDPGLGAGHLQ